MKQVLYLFFLFLLCYSLAEVRAQTYANVPGPENVLVVFNELDSISAQVASYYQQARGIPAENIVGLDSLVNDDIYDPISQTYHQIEIHQDGEIIADQQLSYNPINRHSWRYFIERIATPIKQHIINNNLLNKITAL